jgi:hypothetical protein
MAHDETDEHTQPRPVGAEMRCRLADDWGFEQSRARSVVALLFADPALTLGAPSEQSVEAHVCDALDDYDFGAVGVHADERSALHEELLSVLREGLDGERPGPIFVE